MRQVWNRGESGNELFSQCSHMRNEQIILKKFLRVTVRPVFNESRKRVSIAAVLCSACSDRALGVPACRNTFMINFYDSAICCIADGIINISANFRRQCATKMHAVLTSERLRKIASYLEMHLHKDLTSRFLCRGKHFRERERYFVLITTPGVTLLCVVFHCGSLKRFKIYSFRRTF